MFRLLLVSVSLAACASSSMLAPLQKPDGSWHLRCGATLDNCVKQAEDLCKGRGFVVLSGMSKRKLYGAELGVSQYEVREAELDIACADRRGELPTVQYPAPTPAAPAVAPVPAAIPVAAPAPVPVVAPAPVPVVAPAPVPVVAPAPVPVVAPAPVPVVAPAPVPVSPH